MQAAIVSQARQDGALYVISRSKGIDRTALDAAWNGAPPAARYCARATASRTLGLSEVCTDSAAPVAFLAPLKLSLGGADRPAAQQALACFTAKAQGEWAEALIAKVKASGPPPASKPTAAKAQPRR